jgi:hypothetical protein
MQAGQAAARPSATPAPHATRTNAPAVYRPQPTPVVLQRKTVAGQSPHQATQTARTHASPTHAHSPHEAHAVLQAKTAVTHAHVNNAPSARTPPPAYRPNPVPHVLQPKRATASAPIAGRAQTHPSAPPVYRPEPKRVMQLKESAVAPQARQAHTASRNVAPNVIVPSRTLNTRAASPLQSRQPTPAQITGARATPARPLGPQPRRAVLQAKLAGRGFGVIQRMRREKWDDDFIDDEDDDFGVDYYSSKDKGYREPKIKAPNGYMHPSDFDKGTGHDHSDLDGKVWVKKVNGWPALWWVKPEEQVNDFQLQGTRAKDIQALTAEGSGFTWHHCADYANGACTMQLVPTAEHSSWGHIGGAALAVLDGMLGYKGAKD